MRRKTLRLAVRLRETKRMTTVAAHILGVSGTRGHIPNEMTSGNTDHWMPDDLSRSMVFQKRVATVARMFDKAVSARDGMHAMAE